MALAGKLITVDGDGRIYADRLAVRLPDEQADPTLARLIEWAAERSPVTVTGDFAGEAIDLDQEPDAAEPEGLIRLLSGHKTAKGRLLATPEAARAAYRGGVRTMVTAPVLPPLLAVLSAMREAQA
jgi:hypothetical protein